jgi:hypothetical protein
MTIEVGKLYSCSEYFLLLFPDKETAARTTAAGICRTGVLAAAARTAAYWSEMIDKPVSYCNPQTPLLVLSVKEQYIEVLAGEQRCWAICQGWLNMQEIVDAAA